jgi:hypothetical protein
MDFGKSCLADAAGQQAVVPDAMEPIHCPAGDCAAIYREGGRTWIRERRMNSGVASRMIFWRSPFLTV